MKSRSTFYVSVVLLVLCAGSLAVGLSLHERFFPGSALTLIRWPLCACLVLLTAAFALQRRPLGAFLALSFAFAGVGNWAYVRYGRAAPSAHLEQTGKLTVLTHNLLYRGGDDSQTVPTLLGADADVIALQEVTPAWVVALNAALGSAYPHRALSPHRGTLGFAVYSRYPLKGVVLLGQSAASAYAQCMDVTLPDGPVALCNVHLYSPAHALGKGSGVTKALESNARLRASQWAQVRRHLELRADGERRIAAGDFNTAEVEPLYTAITRDYVDAFRELSPLSPGFTWPHRGSGDTPFVRIDYVLTRGPIAPLAAEVQARTGSDHLPVKVTLGLERPRNAQARSQPPSR